VAGVTSVPFACVTLDWWPAEKCDWGTCPWARASVSSLELGREFPERSQLSRALKALSPVALRVGGSLQDLVTYGHSCVPFARHADRVGFAGGRLSARRYDEIDDLAREALTPLIFGLSGLHGRERTLPGPCTKCEQAPFDPCWTGVWRAREGGSRELLQRMRERSRRNVSALAAVSLGNELCGIGGIAAHLAPEAIARDYEAVDDELSRLFGESKSKSLAFPPVSGRPLLVGPDCQLPLEKIEAWNTRFLARAGAVLDAFSYHLYWLGSGEHPLQVRKTLVDRQLRFSREQDDDDATSLQTRKPWPPDRAFHARLTRLERSVAKASPHTPIWVTESGGAYGSGAPNVTDAFVSAFWYLDELALMARRSVAVHCRQALLGGHYSLLRRLPSGAFAPNPDFHATRLWSALMGARALEASLVGPPLKDARAFAHCRLAARTDPGFGDVVFLVLNSASRRGLRLDTPPALAHVVVREEFHVSGADSDGRPTVDGRRVLLNGKLLDDIDATLEPRRVPAHRPLLVDPVSYAFIVFRDARWPHCTLPLSS